MNIVQACAPHSSACNLFITTIRDRNPRSKSIDLRPVVRDHRDLIGAVSRCVRQPRRPSKLPQTHSQRSLKTETGSNQLCGGLSPYSGIL